MMPMKPFACLARAVVRSLTSYGEFPIVEQEEARDGTKL